MSKHLKVILLAALALTLLAAAPALAHARTTYKTSTPVLSATPYMGKDFSVSGVITPASTAKSRATVKVKLLMEMDGKYDVMDVYTAKLAKMPAGKKGAKYSRTLNIPMTGKHAVQVLQYRHGKLVSKSQIVYFDVQPAALQITIDPNSQADVTAPANTPIDVVFPGQLMGCAANIGFPACPGLVKTSSSPLTFHSDGLPAGSYAWKCSMVDCHYGTLVVTDSRQITIDPSSQADVTAPANTPIDVVFPGQLMGCAANIGFPACPGLVKTSSSPLTFHSDGLPAGSYAWKCSMVDCHHGNLIVQ